MSRILLSILYMIFLFTPGFAQSLEYHKLYSIKDDMSADEIMRIKYHNKYSLFSKDYQQKGEVYYIDPNGFTRKRIWKRMRIVLGDKGPFSYKDLVVITYPTNLKGLAVLTWTYKDPDKEQQVWLWVPSLKKVRKISASCDDDAFLGSDFTVEEVSTRRFEDETYKLVGKKKFPGYKCKFDNKVYFKDRPCMVIEAYPKRKRWYYAKRVVWVDIETGGNILEEYYDAKGRKIKILFRKWGFTDVDGKKYPTQFLLEAEDLKTGHRTTIVMKDTKFDQGLSEQIFTVKTLMRSRW